MFDLQGHRALVTGAGRGAGAGIAAALAARGAAVAVNDLDESRARETVERITATGAVAVAVPFDVTDAAAVTIGIADAGDRLGGHVDVLVNNAGVPTGMGLEPFRDMTPESWRPFVDLNLYGSLYCIRSVVDDMVEAGWGRIVQISSSAGRTGVGFGVSLYGASKSAIEGFVRHLSQELAPNGVTVNSVALGLLANALDPDTPERVITSLSRTIPVGRLGQPEDVGAAVVYLASEEASWITGQTIGLNGGATTN
jgi:3-oxoacyl-[acyl-carrier protein] reductase